MCARVKSHGIPFISPGSIKSFPYLDGFPLLFRSTGSVFQKHTKRRGFRHHCTDQDRNGFVMRNKFPRGSLWGSELLLLFVWIFDGWNSRSGVNPYTSIVVALLPPCRMFRTQLRQTSYSSSQWSLQQQRREAESMDTSAQESSRSSRDDIIANNFWYTTIPKGELVRNDDKDIVFPSDPRSRSTVARPKQSKAILLPSLPCVPTLDTDGPLPPDMYYHHLPTTAPSSTIREQQHQQPASTDSPKPTSRIQIAWDVSHLCCSGSSASTTTVQVTTSDISDMVSNIHCAMDHGFTTFQIKSESPLSSRSSSPSAARSLVQSQRAAQRWAEATLYGSLIRDTPPSVLQHCQLVVPFSLHDATIAVQNSNSNAPSTSWEVSPKSIRSAVVEKLQLLGGSDSLDNLQIRFPLNQDWGSRSWERPDMGRSAAEPYYLDLLSGLQELQRDGLIRTISTANMPCSTLEHARRVGLDHLIATNQIDANLLNPPFSMQSRKSSSPPKWTIVSNSLAGGWLTDRFGNSNEHNTIMRLRPASQSWRENLSTCEQSNWDTMVVQKWGSKHVKSSNKNKEIQQNVWDAYQSTLLVALEDIARKHRVSIAAVVLQWTLRCDSYIASTVVACRVLPDHCYDWKTRQQQHTLDSSSYISSRVKDLRGVVRFQLDDDDMARLSEIAGPDQPRMGISVNDDETEEQWASFSSLTSRNGLVLPRRTYL